MIVEAVMAGGLVELRVIYKIYKGFNGSLENPDVMTLCGCSRPSYYKYKKVLKNSIEKNLIL